MISLRSIRRLGAAALATMLLGLNDCGDPESPCGGDLCWATAIVYGTVQTSSGTPMSDLTLRVSVFENECRPGVGRGDGPAHTDALGRFHAEITSATPPFTARCIRVATDMIQAPDSPRLSREFAVRLELKQDNPAAPTPRDSVGVTVTN